MTPSTSSGSIDGGHRRRRWRRWRFCCGWSARASCVSCAALPSSTATASPRSCTSRAPSRSDVVWTSWRCFVAAGMRSLGLVWSRPNAFATGVPFEYPGSPDQGPGLTERGRALVRACDSLGVVVDVSHLNARGFWDVAALTEAPLVASHCGGARAVAVAAEPAGRPAARDRRERRDRRDQLPRRLPARRLRGRPGHAGRADRAARGACRRGRRRRRRRAGVGLRRGDDAARAGGRGGAAARARRAALRRVLRGGRRGDRVGQLGPCPQGDVDLASDLAALVRIPSETGSEREALTWLAQRASALGFDVVSSSTTWPRCGRMRTTRVRKLLGPSC